jgi:hypothetical protein
MAFGLSAPSASPRLARLLGASPRSSIGRFLDASAPARTQKRTRPRQRTTRTRTLRGPPPRPHPPVLPRMRLLRDLPPHHLLPRRRPCPGALDPHLSSSSSYIIYTLSTPVSLTSHLWPISSYGRLVPGRGLGAVRRRRQPPRIASTVATWCALGAPPL